MAQIRHLSSDRAARALPVRLTGVVTTEAWPPGRAAVIADETGGVYVLGDTGTFPDFRRGDLLEVEGTTDLGEFAPIVLAKSVRRVGTGPVPPPQLVLFEQLATGSLDAQLVEVSGVVRSCEAIDSTNEFGKWHMELAVGLGRLMVASNGERPPELEPDAEVRVRGACFYQFNQKRQVLSPIVFISSEVPVQIEKPAPADPFAGPLRSVASLLQFAPENDYLHRVCVRGVVTHQQGGAMVWIRDRSSGLRVLTSQHGNLRVGDEIDVVGYPRFGAVTPVLEDSVFRWRKSGPAPAPVALETPNLAYDHEEDLISVDALLSEVRLIAEGWEFTLQEKGIVFRAILRVPQSPQNSAPWRPGSRVRVTGICSLIADDTRQVISGVWHPQSFQVLLRSPVDMVILRPPPSWTPQHIMMLCGTIAGLSLLATAVVMIVARRHVREQELQRAMAETEFAAILSERNRMAREIHDTLAQGLAATSVQLRLARKHADGTSGPLVNHLDAAQDLVRSNLEEARNSIWNMRSHVLETHDLAGALNGILKQLAGGNGVKTSVNVTGKARRLAPVVENNILRIGQEAISNATKHSHALRITVELDFGDRSFHLRVIDDGQGFDPANLPRTEGGFGLVGMRERAAELKGELDIVSAPGQGARVTLNIPLSAD